MTASEFLAESKQLERDIRGGFPTWDELIHYSHDAFTLLEGSGKTIMKMREALEAVLTLRDGLPRWHQPDDLPGREYDVGYYDGIVKAAHAIESALAENGGNNE